MSDQQESDEADFTQKTGKEKAWVKSLKDNVDASFKELNMVVKIGVRLPYTFYVSSYRQDSIDHPSNNKPNAYQTDLLIAEQLPGSTDWVPRVVVECKLRTVNTHDVLAYSAKAATHKNVHPYLRYGMVIGEHPKPVPRRLIWHGHQFDFMLTLASNTLTTADRDQLCTLLHEEVRASQETEKLLSGKATTTLVHRKLDRL